MFAVSFTAQKFRLQGPLRPCITPVGSFASQAQWPLLVRGICKVVVFCLVPISCSERCFRAPRPEQSWSCWSHSRGEPRAFPEQGWIKSPAPLGWGEMHTEEKREQEPQLESPSCLSMGPFFGSCSSQAKANKENRSINSSRLPQKLLAFPAGVWLCLGWAPSTYLAGTSIADSQVLLKSWHGQVE